MKWLLLLCLSARVAPAPPATCIAHFTCTNALSHRAVIQAPTSKGEWVEMWGWEPTCSALKKERKKKKSTSIAATAQTASKSVRLWSGACKHSPWTHLCSSWKSSRSTAEVSVDVETPEPRVKGLLCDITCLKMSSVTSAPPGVSWQICCWPGNSAARHRGRGGQGRRRRRRESRRLDPSLPSAAARGTTESCDWPVQSGQSKFSF